MTFRIAVLDDYQQAAEAAADWSTLEPAAQITFYDDYVGDRDALIARLHQYHAVVTMRERTPLAADVLEQLPELRLVATTGPANAAIDVAAADRLGIPVIGTDIGPGMASTLEHTWALLLALARHVVRGDADVRAGRWQQQIGTTLQGSALGLVGLGRIGSRMPAVAASFGMRVLAWSRNMDPATARRAGAEPVTRAQLFENADIVSVHVKLSERSYGYVTAEDLGRMRPTSILINTSRAQVVDEEALIRVLRSGAIAGAGIDVFAEEPLPHSHPLTALPNTVLSPHVGYVTRETYATFYGQVVEGLQAFMKDGSLVRQIRSQ